MLAAWSPRGSNACRCTEWRARRSQERRRGNPRFCRIRFSFVPFVPFCGYSLSCIGHTYVVADQLAHFFGRNNSLLRFFASASAFEIGGAIAAAQHLHNCALELDRLARQFE